MMSTNTIPLDVAQAWAARWRATEISDVKAFLIPHDDITQLMEEDTVLDVRAYIGIDDEGGAKLMLVGVDKYNKDLINYPAGLYVYDFTQPCPTNCDYNSPLYTLK